MAKLILRVNTDNQMIISKITKDMNEQEIVCIPDGIKLTALDKDGVWRNL